MLGQPRVATCLLKDLLRSQTPTHCSLSLLGTPDLKVTIRIMSEAGTPVEQAAVRLIGEQASIQGLTESLMKVATPGYAITA